MSSAVLNELSWRGLLHQTTGEAELTSHLAEPRRIYIGFDPTADSLTIGNLVPIMVLLHLQRAGHAPVVVMGGGTGLIGDPSGKTAERQLRTIGEVNANVDAQRGIFQRYLDFDGPNAATIVNNHDWLGEMGYIEMLRDVGKHFSVNMMMQKDSIRERLHNREQGISYTEFSYMILQAFDFLHLFRSQGVTVQGGGSDQWGNIVAGCDLIRRAMPEGQNASFAFTAPLVTKADGGKFGKTESGAVWLTAARTSPYQFYQFWLNASDEDVPNFLRLFTLLDQATIDGLLAEHTTNPGARVAHRALAREATARLHGDDALNAAEAASAALFSGDVRSIPESMLDDAFGAAPQSEHDRALLTGGDGVALLDVVAETIAGSKSQARQLLTQGSVSVNGDKATLETRLSEADLLHGRVIVLRRGKKTWHVTKWQA